MDSFLVARMEKLLVDKLVSFWLSPSGKDAVKDVFQGKEAFKAYVESVSELGVWLSLPSKKGAVERDQLLLLKWEYMAAAQVSAEMKFKEGPEIKERIQ